MTRCSKVSAARAMLNGIVDRALKCDFSAIRQVIDLLKDSGHDQDVTDEEFAARKYTVMRPFTEDQYDLMLSEARKREYCGHAVLADYRLGFKVSEPEKGDAFYVLLKAADHERIEGRLSKALAAYSKMLETLESGGNKGDGSEATLSDRFERILIRIALLASDFIFARQPELALRAATLADRPNTPINWLPLVRAHAHLLLGNIEPARSFYFAKSTFWREAETSWERMVMLDFGKLRAAGFDHPLMAEVERRYTAAGWSVEKFSCEVPAEVTAAWFDGSPPRSLKPASTTQAQAKPKIAPRTDTALAETQSLDRAAAASDTASGDKLFTAGRLDDALAVYKRRVDECSHALKSGRLLPGLVDSRNDALDRIRSIAIVLLASDRISDGLSLTEYLTGTMGDNTLSRIVRAHALMLSDRVEEARNIYLATYSLPADGERDGRRVIIEDFAELSSKGIEHQLMDEMRQVVQRRVLTR